MVTAILYLPDGMPEDETVRRRLALYCERKGYELSTAHFDGWATLHEYAVEHEAVVVVADWGDIPADRLPRIEVADPGPDDPDDPPEHGGTTRRRRRPRPV